ncbi:MAG: hypothetical protein WC295_01550 [Methanoregula sp.]
MSLSKTIPEQENKAESDTTNSSIPAPGPGADCVSHPGFGFPWTLITGHTITWLDYPNGTEVVRISANGAPPISEDFLIFLIDIMKDYGALKDESWRCVSLEANIDSRHHRIDSSYSMKIIEGVIAKCYQHDYVGRLEIADRRTHGIKEIMDLFHSVSGTVDGQGLIREQQKFEKRVEEQVQMISKKSELAYQVATKERDHRLAAKRPGTGRQKTPAPASSFLTGSQLKRDHSPAATTGGDSSRAVPIRLWNTETSGAHIRTPRHRCPKGQPSRRDGGNPSMLSRSCYLPSLSSGSRAGSPRSPGQRDQEPAPSSATVPATAPGAI